MIRTPHNTTIGGVTTNSSKFGVSALIGRMLQQIVNIGKNDASLSLNVTCYSIIYLLLNKFSLFF